MAGSKGRKKSFEPLQISGIDTRVWQKSGSASDIRGAFFTLKGEVAKSAGIKPIYDKLGPIGLTWPDQRAAPVAGTLTPFAGKIYALGVFRHHGAMDIFVQYNDAGGEFSFISVIRAGKVIASTTGYGGATNGLAVASSPNDSYRMIQSSDIMIFTNGVDPNFKWDGVKFSPLGISSLPPPPVVPSQTLREISEVAATGGNNWFDSSTEGPPYVSNRSNGLWESFCIKSTIADQLPKTFEYRMTWANDKGQESEPGPPSNRISDSGFINDKSLAPCPVVGVPLAGMGDAAVYYVVRVIGLAASAPSLDIAARNVYRSTDKGLTWQFHSRLPGNNTDSMWDFARPEDIATDDAAQLPEPGINQAPPIATWAFPFRTRTYYGGLYDQQSTLAYSNDQGGKEGVATDNYVEISSHDADKLTGFSISQDYVLIFKRRSFYMLTHDKAEIPILTPVSSGVGAVSDKAIISFEGTAYWISERGFYSYDGAKTSPVSMELNERFKSLPPAHLKDAFAWVDLEERRLLFSVCGGPGPENREIWVIHADSGAFSVLDGYEVGAAVNYDKYTYVGYFDGANHDIGMWGVQGKIGGYNDTVPVVAGVPIGGSFKTAWLSLDNPNSDKTFYRLDLFYTQTTTNPLNITWCLDWDERLSGSREISLAENDATVWEGAAGPTTWGTAGLEWDSHRVRSLRIDLTDSEERPLNGKCIRFEIADEDLANSTESPWRIVGFLLHYADFGTRSEGTDIESAT